MEVKTSQGKILLVFIKICGRPLTTYMKAVDCNKNNQRWIHSTFKREWARTI